jgi:hypothetical protein
VEIEAASGDYDDAQVSYIFIAITLSRVNVC